MKNILLIKEIDKANHFIVGYLIYFFSFIFIGVWAVIPLVVIAFLKELWDVYRHRMIFDWKDFCYTLAGGFPAFILSIN